MKTIQLNKGYVITVDDSDYEAVSKFKWYPYSKPGKTTYAVRQVRRPEGHRGLLYLHQFLIPGAVEIDHKDGNGLNNCRDNIRAATNQQNQRSFKRKRSGATSIFRGVSWNKCSRKWQAEIQVSGKGVYLGVFLDESDAARTYDKAAREFFGDFASPNFI